MNAAQGSSRLQAVLAIARRDLLEFVRDRRTLFITLLLPMATYPIMALSTALGLRAASSEIEAQQAPTKIAVVLSGEDAPALAARLAELDRTRTGHDRDGWPAKIEMAVVPPPEARALIDRGDADLWVEVESGFIRALDATATVVLPVSLPAGRPTERRVREQFESVAKSLAQDVRQRRIARAGLPASVLAPLDVVFKDENRLPHPPRSILSTLAGGVLVLLAVLTLTGAFYPAIDAIAGEKERGTIETLLIAPCSVQDIVHGKFLAVFAVTLATLVVNVLSIAATAAVSKRFLPGSISMTLPDGAAAALIVTVLAFTGLAALAAATCLAVTTASKTGKEAQNTLTPVILLVSALAGAAILPGMRADSALAALPFAGQVVVARSMFAGGEAGPDSLPEIAGPLALTLVAAGLLTWLLLRATATLLADEDTLFRGPDTATGAFARPGYRPLPSMLQGVAPIILGLAALWYVQGFSPDDLVLAIPLQQAAAVLAPLALVAWWQRVDLRQTFAIAWPGPSTRHGRVWPVTTALTGAALCGAGVFVLGAAALLAARGTGFSEEARHLTERLISLMRDRPTWLAWCLIALVPAVCEELLFRGWTLSAFAGAPRSPARTAWAVIAQAACFAIFHLLPERMPQTFLLGAVLGWMTVVSGSLLPAMVAHLAHNSMAILLVSLAGGLSGLPPSGKTDDAVALVGIPPWAVVAAVGAVILGALLLWSSRRRDGSE
jgi:sodium transport system permease protein